MRSVRGVQDRCPVEPYVTRFSEADFNSATPNHGLVFVFRDSSQFMGAGRHLQRCIVLVHIIQVQARRNHRPDQRKWRLDMNDASFDVPVVETRDIGATANRNRPILVPSERPVQAGSFVEQKRTDWAGGTS